MSASLETDATIVIAGQGILVANLDLRPAHEALRSVASDTDRVSKETGDRHGEGTALGNLGLALVEVRRFDEAITAHQDAAAIFRETGDPHGEDIAVNNLKLAPAAKAEANSGK